MRTVDVFAAVVSVGLVLLLVSLAVIFSNFWMVFALPAVVLSLVQTVAIRSGGADNAAKIFVVTDFIYYAGIGGGLGLVSIYLPEIERVIRYDTQTTYESAIAKLPDAREDSREASERSARTKQWIEEMDPAELGDCLFRQDIEQRQRLFDDDGWGWDSWDEMELSPYPPGCQDTLGVLDAAPLIQREARERQEDVRDLSEVIDRGPEPDEGDLPDEERVFWWLYIGVPMLLLCGIALKIGKTTHALLKP